MPMVIPLSDEPLSRKIAGAFSDQEFPPDLKLAGLLLAISIAAIYLPFVNETPIRVVFAFPVLLFIPGYCLAAALFPRKGDFDSIEWIALSVGLSLILVSFIGFVVNFTPWGIRLDPLVTALSLLTLALILVAHVRRIFLPFDERFRVPFSRIREKMQKGLLPAGGSRADRRTSIILACGIILAIITIVWLIAYPLQEERFSEFYLLGENQVAADYPHTILAGQNYPMFIGVKNYEFRDITYTIETWNMVMNFDDATNTSSVIAMDPQERVSFSLAQNETRIIPYNLSVPNSRYNRVEFLLFRDTVPDLTITGSNRINASYRDLNLAIVVS